MARKKKLNWVAIGAISALLTLIVTMWIAWAKVTGAEYSSGISVFFADSSNTPKTDVVVVFSDGLRIEPNLDGIVLVPHTRSGYVASVRSQTNRRELCTIRVPESASETLKVTTSETSCMSN